ncbi:MAG TPA: acyltransferase [Candidatus Acidoferrales bacterium]|jgi:peptidoglycan/LPS O-acetylase OafA/YrhL|nr:acyltransferase [Candidatus Acidoferrales bacterium]
MTESARRIPQLDGIRGTAILLVVVWHFIVVPIARAPQPGVFARLIAHAGLLMWSGVDLFFVLSGFLIGGILFDAKDSSNYFSTFYLRRVFRILPIYLVVVVAYLLLWSLAAGRQTTLRETLGSPMPWYVYFTFTQNFWLAHHAWDAVYLTLSWSLAVEEQFYLLLPAIIRLLPRFWLLPAAVALAFGSVAARSLMYVHYGPSWGTAAYTLIVSRADALMLGVICSVLLRDAYCKEILTENTWIIRTFFGIFAFGVAVLTYKGWGAGTMPMCTLGFTCVALFYASLLMIAMVSQEGILSRAFRIRWLMWLGTIAYALYLFHEIILDAVFRLLLHHAPVMANGFDALAALLSFVLALCLALVSWKYFESKLVRIGHRFAYGNRPTSRPRGPNLLAPRNSN